MARVSIEDCLKNIENRFALVTVAAHRARLLAQGEQSFVRSRNREAVTALREIAEGYLATDDSDSTVLHPTVEDGSLNPAVVNTPTSAAEGKAEAAAAAEAAPQDKPAPS